MPIAIRNQNRVCSSNYARITPISDIIASLYDFPHEDRVPAGDYVAMIHDIIDTKTAKGTSSIDVQYDLVNPEGRKFNICLRYPHKSAHILALAKSLMREGLIENYLAEAVGKREDITLEYSGEDSLGEIVHRSAHRPPNRKSKSLTNSYVKRSTGPKSAKTSSKKNIEDLLRDDDDDDEADIEEEIEEEVDEDLDDEDIDDDDLDDDDLEGFLKDDSE